MVSDRRADRPHGRPSCAPFWFCTSTGCARAGSTEIRTPIIGRARRGGLAAAPIAHAHGKGMRVGLYCRGIERYCLDAKFFEKYCRRDWDGLYVDWHGPQCVAYHEHHYRPDASLGDDHFSTDGSRAGRPRVFSLPSPTAGGRGPPRLPHRASGIRHGGRPAELGLRRLSARRGDFDHAMFADVDQAVYRGMLGAAASAIPWTLNSPRSRVRKAIAKMAAWGFFPHVGLGMERPADKLIFPLDPNAKINEFALPYWRILAAIDMREAQVFNLPNQKPIAATCSDEDVRVLICKERRGRYLAVAANLSTRPAKATVNLDPQVLGMTGSYAMERVDAQVRHYYDAASSLRNDFRDRRAVAVGNRRLSPHAVNVGRGRRALGRRHESGGEDAHRRQLAFFPFCAAFVSSLAPVPAPGGPSAGGSCCRA